MEKKVSGKQSNMNGFAMIKGRMATVVLPSLDRFQTYTTFSSGLNEPSIILDKTL